MHKVISIQAKMKSTWIANVILIVIIVILVIITVRGLEWPIRGHITFPEENPRVLFVFAHPDDETMFFAPTILALRHQKIPIYFLCLSPGDHEGRGLRRRQELIRLGRHLGIPEENIEIKSYRDQPNLYWNSDEIATDINSAVNRWNITTVISFDELGVSGHANHISCYRGLQKYQGNVKRYKLISKMKSDGIANICVNVNSWSYAMQMLSYHKSQFTWWRKLGLILGSHTYRNQLKVIT